MNNQQAPFEFLLQQSEVTKISAPTGTILSSIGAPCHNFIILQQGLIRIYRPAGDGRSITLYHVGEGESCILTASCVLNTQPFPAIAKIEKNAEGLVLPAKQIHLWLKTEPQRQQYIFFLLSQRIEDLIHLVDALAFRHLDVRLAKWLSEHSNHSKIIPTTHQIIADDLASSREVISRLLKEFERDRIIKLSRGVIEIIDRNKINNFEQSLL